MTVKKSNGKIYGANFTAAERKAMELEIQRQIVEYNDKNATEISAMVLLYILHTEFGFGKKRLRDFFNKFTREIEALGERYLMMDNLPFLCVYKLKQAGIDVLAWEKEGVING